MVTSTRGRRFPPEPLDHDDVYALMAACSRRGPTGVRNRALIALLAATGLRISEALALRLKDIDFKAGTVRVLHGKGDRSRTVALLPNARDPLERWLDLRDELNIPRSSPVFCQIRHGREGKPVQPAYVRQMLPRLARKAGIEKRVHAHGLRHGVALYLSRREGVTLKQIQVQLGHARPSTTDVYLRQLAGPAELVEMFRRDAAELKDGPTPERDPVDELRRQVAELRHELAELRRTDAA